VSEHLAVQQPDEVLAHLPLRAQAATEPVGAAGMRQPAAGALARRAHPRPLRTDVTLGRPMRALRRAFSALMYRSSSCGARRRTAHGAIAWPVA